MISVVYATAADFEGRQTEGSFKDRVESLAALIPVPAEHVNKVIYVLLSAAACKRGSACSRMRAASTRRQYASISQ